ncbi:MAG: FtsX-like permease family protein [Anaerorhabdus sp.]
MKKNLLIDAFRMISKTKTKFITLFAIVALGISFFIGISATAPMMSYSVDGYNDKYNLMDIEMYSAYGFSEEDIEAINNLSGVVLAEGRKFVDAISLESETDYVTRIIGYDENKTINQFNLLDGRLPQSNSECVVGVVSGLNVEYQIGDKISLGLYEEDLSETLKSTELEVVGLVETPEFLHSNNGYSTLSNQFIVYYLFVQESSFKTDYFSSAVIVAQNMKEYNSFSAEYLNAIETVKNQVEVLGETQATYQRDIVLKEAQELYDEGLLEYEDGKKEAEEELATAKQKLIDGAQEIQDGKQEIQEGLVAIEDARSELVKQKEATLAELNAAQAQVNAGYSQYRAAKKEFDEVTKPGLVAQKNGVVTQLTPLNQAKDGLATLNTAIAQTEAEKEQLVNRKAELESKVDLTSEEESELVEIDVKIAEFDEAIAELNNQKLAILTPLQQQGIADEVALNTAIAALDSGIAQIDAGIAEGEQQLLTSKQTLDTNAKKIEVGYITLDYEISEGEKTITEKENELIDGQNDLVQAEQDLKTGQIEYDDAVLEVEAELAEGKQELDDAKAELDELGEAQWSVLDRSQHYSSKSYADTVEQMRQISRLFPVFFFLVAALVCSTTMTRMVDEQRGQIGTLRSLGYSKFACTLKYLIYALSATLAGSIVGVIVGLAVFPPMIYNAWKMMYQLPPMQIYLSYPMIIGAVLAFVVLMIVVTWSAAAKEMKEITSQLLRPKPPTAGKRILLERIPLIWKNLSFTSKVTVRNLFRYKKRFFMTVLGIGGCTALLVAAFGLRGSIGTVVEREFKELYQVDGYIQLESGLTTETQQEVMNNIVDREEVESAFLAGGYSAVVKSVDGVEESVTVTVVEDDEMMKEIRNVVDRKTKEVYQLTHSGVLINEKLGILFDLSVGDTFLLEGEDGEFSEVVVEGMFESYVNHTVFISNRYYEQQFGTNFERNSVFVNFLGESNNQELSKIENVESLGLFEPIIASFDDMIQGMDVVIYVLIFSAGLLAFIVLSNLTSVNISERQREIATLKVLGFNVKEVNAYIFKENLLLVFFGILLGFVLGRILHLYVILLIEMDFVMFGRGISWVTYLTAALLTFIFAIIVNLIVSATLRKIKMVESLKSVE